MSLVPNLALGGAGGNPGSYTLSRSLRFRSSASASLSKTFGVAPTSRTTMTYSAWIKRGAIGAGKCLFGTANNYESAYFQSDDTLYVCGPYMSGQQGNLTTTQVFRDPSAWYHIVIVYDTTNATAADRIKLYVNGSRVTSFSSSTNSNQNNTTTEWLVSGTGSRLGVTATVNYFDGYFAELNVIDGQALTPSSFGETDATTGVWIPKKYSGAYGNNGCYLPFTDNTSATTLAYDKSGNSNNWTANNISTTAGSTYDSMLDVPTLTSATAANFAVLNPLHYLALGTSLSNANLTAASINGATSPYWRSYPATINVSSGKWYCEVVVGTTNNGHSLGIASAFNSNGIRSTYYEYNFWDQVYDVSGTTVSYGAKASTGQIIGMAVDLDNGTIEWFVNGSSQGQKTGVAAGNYFLEYSLGWGNGAAQTGSINFGQRPFSYTPPTGFVALNTFNLPDPTIKKPNQYMDVSLWTGTNATQTITNAGFQPDLVWSKMRNGAYNNALFNSVVGAGSFLSSNLTNGNITYNPATQDLTGFVSNGFTLGISEHDVINKLGSTYVGWQWKASGTTVSNTSGSITSTVSVNATAGFSIVSFAGNGSTGTVGHGLGVAPSLIIHKDRSGVGDWAVYSSTLGATKGLFLDTTNAETTSANFWNNTAPTSSVVSLGAWTAASGNKIMYCWTPIAGYSKFGSYTGNGSTDGPFVYCGFRPKYVMIKNTASAEAWTINDGARNTYNVTDSILYPNSSDAEGVGSGAYIDFVGNGFKIRNSNPRNNANGSAYIYAAFAENPMKYSLAR